MNAPGHAEKRTTKSQETGKAAVHFVNKKPTFGERHSDGKAFEWLLNMHKQPQENNAG